jgi:hypothetical protein
MTKSTLEKVKAALIKSGYGPDSILSATYMYINASGSEVYRITYLDDDGKEDSGNVYIDKDGKGEF